VRSSSSTRVESMGRQPPDNEREGSQISCMSLGWSPALKSSQKRGPKEIYLPIPSEKGIAVPELRRARAHALTAWDDRDGPLSGRSLALRRKRSFRSGSESLIRPNRPLPSHWPSNSN
jgi:hypothetical protein